MVFQKGNIFQFSRKRLCKFLIPEKYHEYLRAAYGDYMVLPPIEKRENQHLIVEVSFGDE